MHHPFHAQAELGAQPKSPTKTRPPGNSQAPAPTTGPSPRPTTWPTSPPNASQLPRAWQLPGQRAGRPSPRPLPPCGGRSAERAAGQIFRNSRQPMVALWDVPNRCPLLKHPRPTPLTRPTCQPAEPPTPRLASWLTSRQDRRQERTRPTSQGLARLGATDSPGKRLAPLQDQGDRLPEILELQAPDPTAHDANGTPSSGSWDRRCRPKHPPR